MLTAAILIAARPVRPVAGHHPPRDVRSATVVIEDFAFHPQVVHLRVGGTVTFVNRDDVQHTVTPDQGAHFRGSGLLSQGDTFRVTFRHPGVAHYMCSIHPTMTGEIAVR